MMKDSQTSKESMLKLESGGLLSHGRGPLLLLIALSLIAVVVQSVFLLRMNDRLDRLDQADALAQDLPGSENDLLSPSEPGTVDDLLADVFAPGLGSPFGDMNFMRRNMDRLFHDLGSDSRRLPGFGLRSADGFLGGGPQVVDEGDRYLVRLQVQNIDEVELDIKVVDDRLLEIVQTSTGQSASKKGSNRFFQQQHNSRVFRSFTLPGPVDAAGMSVERDKKAFLITLPKKTFDAS